VATKQTHIRRSALYILLQIIPTTLEENCRHIDLIQVGETGVKWDTGSKGTVGGKIVDVNKTLKNFSMLCKSV
jgi:hypothetical protein